MSLYLIKAKYSPQGYKGILERPQDLADSTKIVLATIGVEPQGIYYSIADGALVLIVELNARQIGSQYGSQYGLDMGVILGAGAGCD